MLSVGTFAAKRLCRAPQVVVEPSIAESLLLSRAGHLFIMYHTFLSMSSGRTADTTAFAPLDKIWLSLRSLPI